MEGIGEKLRSAREAKKLTIKEVSKETNISPLYVEALEKEEFDKFPSETYITGFLRNYAEFLKLDAEEMIQSYRGYKIGESATPLEELIKPTSPKLFFHLSTFFYHNRTIMMLCGLILFIVAAGFFITKTYFSEIDIEDSTSIQNIKNEYDVTNSNLKIKNIRNLNLTNNSGYTLLYKNEAVQFLIENKEYMFLLKNIKNNSVILQLIQENDEVELIMEQPRLIKIKNYPRDIIVTLKGLTENRAKMLVMLGKKKKPVFDNAKQQLNDTKKIDNTQVIAQNERNLKIIFEATFFQKTYLELYLDGIQKKKGIIAAGRKERWEATEYIQLKIGNAGGLKIKINGKPYNFGLPGQVANKVITWKKDANNPNLYHIVVKDW
ncbi:MAG: DUF4115 domain-containing protein [Spirochaetota bacterium]|nr:DUF4115 domain-containing protein [Spirochaetota bacterium]